MTVICLPVFFIGRKIDKLIGITSFGKKTNIPQIEIIKMLLIGVINLLIFIFAFYTNNVTFRLLFLIIGIIFFLTLTIYQGNRIQKLNKKIYEKNMSSEQQNALDTAYDTLLNDKGKNRQ